MQCKLIQAKGTMFFCNHVLGITLAQVMCSAWLKENIDQETTEPEVFFGKSSNPPYVL